MSTNVSNLVTHVQDNVWPKDRLPDPLPSTVNPSEPFELGAYHGERPDWTVGVDLGESTWDENDEIVLPPNGTSGTAIDISAVSHDPDVHAFYLPFHFYRNNWGIYIRARSIVALTAYLLNRPVLKGDALENSLARSVFRMLLDHETFHHLTELAISRLELVALEFMPDSLYARNFFSKDSIILEEGMANAYALRELERMVQPMRYTIRNDVLARISGFMEKQPAGYKDFEQYLADSQFRNGKDSLIARAKTFVPGLSQFNGEDGAVVGRHHFVDKKRPELCPVWLVMERGVAVSRLKPFPQKDGMRVYIYTRNEHPPPHLHLFMPPGLEFGSYQWPSLQALKGSPQLTSKDEKKLRQYIRDLQPGIFNKIKKVYPDVDDIK